MDTHTHPVASNLPIKTLVARKKLIPDQDNDNACHSSRYGMLWLVAHALWCHMIMYTACVTFLVSKHD